MYLLLIVGMIPVYVVNTNANTINECMLTANEIKQEIERDENTELTVVGCQTLYDVELNPNYLLIEFSNGYAIVGKNNHIISEYDIVSNDNPYQDFDESNLWIYGGPFNYLQVNSSVLTSRTVNPLNVSDELIELNRNIVSTNIDTNSNARVYNSWTGISASRFTRYDSGKWINSSSNYPSSAGYPAAGICGTIASAIMIAYIQDYINSDYVPSSIRTKDSEDPGKLITTLFTYIDKGKNGTVAIDLCGGINRYLTDYSYQSNCHRAGYGLTTFSTAQSTIDNGFPVCIGMLTALGSDMGDHWVTAYQYIDQDGTTSDRYRCVGNQQVNQYSKVIYVSWTAGIAYIY